MPRNPALAGGGRPLEVREAIRVCPHGYFHGPHVTQHAGNHDAAHRVGEYGNGLDAAVYLPRSRDRLLLGERLVRARLVVEAREFDDEMSQVLLAKDEDVIEKLAS